MTGVLVALLAALWAAVLLPVLLRAKENSSVSVSVGAFNRGMRALSSNHEQPPAVGGRWVLTPRTPLDEPDPREVMFQRRRTFSSLLGSLAFALVASAIPGLHFLLWVSAGLAVALAGYTVFLLNEKTKRQQRYINATPQRAPVRRPPTGSFGFTTVEQQPSAVTVVREGTPRPRFFMEDDVLAEDDVRAEDDGLSELGWAQAR